MIYCPKCGTANRDGSRFCNECGEELAIQTHIECPRCGALNPVQNVLCIQCGGRLLPVAPLPPDAGATPTIKGLSLPIKSPTGKQDDEAAAEPEPENEIPAWLRELGADLSTGSGSEDPDSPEDIGEVPDWLRDLRASLPEEPEDEVEPAEEDETLPDWLAALKPVAGEAEDEALVAESELADEPLAPAPQETTVPGWLSRLVPTAAAQGPEPKPAGSETEETPGWLSRLVPGEAEAETEPAPTTPEMEEVEGAGRLDEPAPEAPAEIEGGEIPDWLADLQAASEEAGVEPPDIEIEEGQIPDWMAALRPVAGEAGSEPAPVAFGIEGEQFPDRVTELEPPSDDLPVAEPLDQAEIEPSVEKPAVKLPDEVEAALGPAVPAWLAQLQVEAPEAAAAIVEGTAVDGELPEWLVRSEVEPDESLSPAEIPGWLLALKPTALREGTELPAPAVREWSEETGLLAGIPGILPVEMLIAQPRAITAVESLDLTVEDSPPARLFSDIVGRPPDATPKEIVQPKADVLPKTARWIIYAILLIVVSLPIIVGEPLVSRTIEPTAATVEMHQAIESLDSLEPVLVAFDYDPTSSGEMDLVARALIGHLMDRGAKLVVVSLLPAGPATAQSLLDELAADRPDYAQSYGERYANLGYLPGAAAAVRLLGLSLETALPRDFYGTPLSELPVMQGLDSTQAFSLIVELAATQDTLRPWIEQASTPYAIPLGTGTSASVIPIARPYYETEPRQLVGLVGGVPDAVTYEALVSDQSSPTSSSAARLDSLLAGQLLFVLVILAGNVAYFWRRGTRRER